MGIRTVTEGFAVFREHCSLCEPLDGNNPENVRL
jgi:hypothetical protein